MCGARPKLRVFNERRLDEAKCPFIMVDATFIKSREGVKGSPYHLRHKRRWVPGDFRS